MILTDKSFEKEILKIEIPALVEFGASWCIPSKAMEPVMDKLEKEYAGKIKIGRMNIDLNPKTAAKYRILDTPTFIIFNNGKEIYREIGARSEKQLRSIIDKHIK